jgi:hypothetical protein
VITCRCSFITSDPYFWVNLIAVPSVGDFVSKKNSMTEYRVVRVLFEDEKDYVTLEVTQ